MTRPQDSSPETSSPENPQPMRASIPEEKDRIRSQCRRARLAMGESFRSQASLDICTKIEAWSAFKFADVILSYLPIKAEVDLGTLFIEYPRKRWVLPRIIPGTDHRMTFHPYEPMQLVRHPYGMLEPVASLPSIDPQDIQLALVPGLAYQHEGWRLGYGGGYYDRFFKCFKGLSLGITFAALLLDQLPHTEHDLPVQWIATETQLFDTQNYAF